ncbi:MAG TPA: hypothetical protein VK897_13675 [Anaerolineales bacterium]|nr:hypothetical protein [Anaerolineales bacterium]
MADIRCPNCGRNNPDILDVCQFCQTPLKPDSVLRIGQQPTKKNTGELEPILPDWLKDVRQQGRDSAEEEEQVPSQRRPQKDEPPDLLAGLASQSGRDEDEVPDWLAGLNKADSPKPQTPAASAPAPETDFFSQFNRTEPEPPSEPAQEESAPWMGSSASEEKDELSAWFTQAAEEQPEELVELDPQAGQDDRGWLSSFDAPRPVAKEPEKPEEDLTWLHNLEDEARQTGNLKAPKQGTDWMADVEMPSTPSQSSSQEDLSWLDSLGGIEKPLQQPGEPTSTSQNDLSWLDQFGEIPESQPESSAEEKPLAVQEDLSWLNNLGAAQEPAQPVDAAPDRPISPAPFASQEDLSWLNALGEISEAEKPPEAAQDIPSAPQEDSNWLQGLGGETEPLSAPPFTASEPTAATPRQTAPLGMPEDQDETEPDWLRNATEAPSMPAPGDVSLDWFNQQDQPADEKAVRSTESAPFADIFSTPAEPAPLSNQDVDSLFSAEMPDWLSRPEPSLEEPATPRAALPPAGSEDSLAPVELPSWVQAMRPVEAAITETAPDIEDQPEETEGPLAGLRGVIPGAPIAFTSRPKAVSLKLQASEEQQASAALLEEILGSETSPRALVTSSFIVSQHALRWLLAALLVLVLGAMVALRSQQMPVSASLPVDASALSSAVAGIPAGANVLVVIDYEPSLTGEMEAIGGPLLNQLVSANQPSLSFVATSPNGTALVERLLTSASINTQYRNLGFLPGGSTGVLGFMEQPGQVLPASQVQGFYEYATVVLLTDHAESGRIWVEQLQNRKQVDPLLAGQSLLVVASAQAGPLLQPYVSSQQITGMISGLSDAARYEASNNRPGLARTYWDTFGIGLALSIVLILVGSLWSLFTGIRARRAAAEQG